MDQNEFLDLLYRALQEEMPEPEVQTNIAYYRGYFSSEMGKGRSEKEVIEELGNPRLIAKTLIDSYKMARTPWNKEYQEQTARRFDEDKDFTQENGKRDPAHYNQGKTPWYYKILLILVLIIAAAVIIAIGGFALSLFFSVILPILICFLLLRMLWSALKK